jgi:hypothetical protein
VRSHRLPFILLFAAHPAWAGVTFETQSPKGQSTIRMEGDKFRVDQHSPDGDRSVLVDNQARTLTVLNPKEKTYSELELDRLETTATESDDTKLNQALSKLPPEQRKRVEESIKQRSGKGGAGGELVPQGPVTFYTLNKKDKVAGYPCEWYRVERDGKTAAEVCYIPFSATGLVKEDFAPVLKTMETLRTLSARFGRGEAGIQEWEKAPGFPGIRIPFGVSGEKRDEERLVSLKKGPVPADLLQVPSDYKRGAVNPRR